MQGLRRSLLRSASIFTLQPCPLSSRFLSTSTHESRLAGKVAIITGGAKGIGKATSRLFLKEGALVAIADVDIEAISTWEQELGCNDKALACKCDVSSDNEVAKMVASVIERWGHLDIMFNNVGIGGSRAGVFDASVHDMCQVMATNVGGALAGTREAAIHMRANGHGGCIINSASACASMGGIAMPLYTASKAAVVSLTKCCAYELAPFGIRVNSLSPGSTPTERWVKQLRSLGFQGSTPLDISKELQKQDHFKGPLPSVDMIAQAALFLADDASGGYISGHDLVVDGALTTTKGYDVFAFMKKN